jgi:aminoglycoside phosphotransferase (APT) family kinase protein
MARLMNDVADPIDLSALTAWLSRNIDGFRAPIALSRFPGGQSNPTYKLTTADCAYVVRAKPPGALVAGAHAIDREYRVISALNASDVPVPTAYAYCDDETVIGQSFFIMDFVPGTIHAEAELPDVSREDRGRCFDAMNETLARLHRVNPSSVGLGDYGKAGGYLERQIRLWKRQYEADPGAGRYERLDRVGAWLLANVPDDDEVSVVHGDYRSHNLIFREHGTDVAAILDWELSTLGHPITDFAFHLMMYRIPHGMAGAGIMGLDLAAFNIPAEADYITAYCERSNRKDIPHLQYHLAYNLYRFAAIIHGIKGRALRGSASSERADAVAASLDTFVDLAWDEAKLAGMV